MIIYKNNRGDSEKLFSTGDSELDDILEEVYYSGLEDGYDYAQKEFASAAGIAKRAERAAKRASKDAWQKSQAKSLFHSGFGGVSPNLSTSRRVLHEAGNATNGSYVEDVVKKGVNPTMAKINNKAGVWTAGHPNENIHPGSSGSFFGEFGRRHARNR